MGFFSDIVKTIGGFGDVDLPSSPIQKEQKEQAQRTIDQALEGQKLKRKQFKLLRKDIRPLRELRNESINRLLRLQGIGQEQDISEFRQAPEFTTVRDAALRIQGDTPGMSQELAVRADQLGLGGFGNFQNRIFNTAGFSAGGVGGTNRLLQQNIDAQANLLNNAGAQAASGLIAGANQRGQAAGSAIGLVGAFCDSRLKDNIEKIGQYDIGINIYRWDWTDEAKEIVGDQPNEGPMAHEVAEVMPDNVGTVDGWLYIKDARLIH